MPGNTFAPLWAGAVAVLLLPTVVRAQTVRQAKAAESAVFSEAMARAKESSRPLIVFGFHEGCSRCAVMKQALATQPELKLLMTQYVSTEVPFGTQDFVAIWDKASAQNPHADRAIGTPAIFIFTAKGDAVYAGRNGGVPPDDEFKRQLILGIERNGGLRGRTNPPPATSLTADVAKARTLLNEGQELRAAETISKYVSSENMTEEVAEVAKLTGLNVARSKTEVQLDSLVQQLSEKGRSLLEATVAAAGTGDATKLAVQLAELERVFGGYPAFVGKFDAAWSELLAKGDMPNLRKQAELIDKARQADSGADAAQVITAYERVLVTYPGTKAAELSQLRITQLQAPKSAPSRLWKSKSGQFTLNAVLIAFDGKSAQLRTNEGKTITVALDALSAEDQEFLKANKPSN